MAVGDEEMPWPLAELRDGIKSGGLTGQIVGRSLALVNQIGKSWVVVAGHGDQGVAPQIARLDGGGGSQGGGSVE